MVRTPECKHCAPCGSREECLGIVDGFFASAPKGSIGLYRTYAKPLNGGDCELCDTTAEPCRKGLVEGMKPFEV